VSSNLATALVSSGATATVAIAGLIHASSISRQGLRAEDRRRLADKKAAAYEQAAEYLLYRKEQRRYRLNIDLLHEKTLDEMRELLSTYDQGRWFASNAQLVLYASEAVKDAVQAANRAHAEVMRRSVAWKRSTSDVRTIALEHGPQMIPPMLVDLDIAAREHTEEALAESGRLEDALIDALQNDLGGEPEPPWVSLMGGPDPGR
jgi:hypothetical protein